MKRIFKWIGATVLVLIGILAFNTLRFTPASQEVAQQPLPVVDDMAVAHKLSQAIQFKTLSHRFETPGRPEAFDTFLDWLGTAFPHATEAMSRTMVGGYTPIYHWKGQGTSKQSILFSGHYDVVPIVGDWSRDPWAGEIADGYVWGRGALDMKGGVIALLQALDQLAQQGFQPENDLYIAITQDEEIGGAGGAAKVVEYFDTNEIKIDWSLDEGSFVLHDVISSIKRDVVSINVAEKGYMTVRITAKARGGHSSTPDRETAVSKLAQAIVDLQADPMDGGLTDLSADFFDAMGRNMRLPERALFANRWLFKSALESILSGANTTDAMLRTTKAPTMLQGSSTENVLPQEASVKVNFRIHPRDDEAAVVAHIREKIANDEIEVEVERYRPPSRIAAHDNEAFAKLSNAARQVFGDVAVVPGLTVGGTDSARYSRYAENSYRFLPFTFTRETMSLMHGRDERIAVKDLKQAVQYYMLLVNGL